MSFNCKNYQFSTGEHRDKNVILVKFPYNQQFKNELREKFPSAKWSRTKNCWYLPDVRSIRIELGLEPKTESGKAVMGYIHAINQEALQKMNELLLLKAYSPNTIRTYCVEFAQLLYILKDFDVNKLTPDQLRSYMLYCLTKLKLSENTMHSRLNAIKFYFEQVLHREKFFFDIPRPKKKKTLPIVLSKRDIEKILEATDNSKHKLMLKMCYGMG